MNVKITLAIAAVSAMALSSFAQGPGPGGPPPGPGGPGMGGPGGPGRGAPVDWSKLPQASDKKGVTYAADIKPILDASCTSCHGATRQQSGVRLDSLEAIMAGRRGRGGTTPLIVTNNSAESVLVRVSSRLDARTAMPPAPRGRGRGPGFGGPGAAGGENTNAPAQAAPPPPKNLTADQVGLIRAWIDQGAK